MKKVVVLTGAGISAESGINTFRDKDGLWEGHDIYEVASPEGWRRNPELVLEFYNERRKQAKDVKPNAGHYGLAELEKYFDVTIITQNVDNLHEQAGSTNVVHLHGQLFQSKSTLDDSLILDMSHWELNIGDKCPRGSQLRPNVVWFGEPVPMIEVAINEAAKADIFLIVGTSLLVYPAAALMDFVDDHIPKYIIDPKLPAVRTRKNLVLMEDKATVGVPKIVKELVKKYVK